MRSRRSSLGLHASKNRVGECYDELETKKAASRISNLTVHERLNAIDTRDALPDASSSNRDPKCRIPAGLLHHGGTALPFQPMPDTTMCRLSAGSRSVEVPT